MDSLPETFTIAAKPYAYTFPASSTALLLIDLQRDFLLPSGFGDIQSGTNLAAVTAAIPHCARILQAFRDLNLPVFHTREGHLPDLSDCPSSKLTRQAAAPGSSHTKVIGDEGSLGRLLVRGENGHDIVDECRPRLGEVVVDKPGKGAFWNTNIMEELVGWGITHLIVGGVTTECCVTTTVREANDRGFECCIIEECTAGYNDSFKGPSLDMIHWSQGLFGFVSTLGSLMQALTPHIPPSVHTPSSDTTPGLTFAVWDGCLTLTALRKSYSSGVSPVTVLTTLYTKIYAHILAKTTTFIYLTPKSTSLARAEELQTRYPDTSNLPPLYGVPFTLKDSIDVSGIPTTLACPPLSHIPSRSASIYTRLISLGAIFIGKTNLDQFATGLTGCRSPYGVPSCIFDESYIAGGSSSGSAVSVGAGLVSFAIATDTAGSGRVPAGFNGVVGWKPTKGTVSFSGVMKACQSLDCLSFMATPSGGVADVRRLWNLVRGFDPSDAYAKPPGWLPVRAVDARGAKRPFRFAIPDMKAVGACSGVYRKMFYDAVEKLQGVGGEVKEGDWELFEQAGRLLYDGALVNERLSTLPDDGWVEREKEELHPVILEIFRRVLERGSSAAEVYRDLNKMAVLTRKLNSTLFNPSHPSYIDVLVVPTTPFHPQISAVLEDPIALNSRLGIFTHFGNVLDMCAVALPTGYYTIGSNRVSLPFSITMLGRGGNDARVLEIARLFEGVVGVGGRGRDK